MVTCDDAFSIGTELERAGIAGQSADSRCLALLRKQKTKRIGGERPLPLRCLSQFLPMGEKINYLRNMFFVCTFHQWGGLVFIVSDFPNWMVIRTLSYWGWAYGPTF